MTLREANLSDALMILAESAEVGGDGGLLGGPVGAVVGVGLGLGAGGLIVLAIERANKDHSDSRPGALEQCPSNAAEEADEDIKCFKPRSDKPNQNEVFKTTDRAEFERSVKMAQDEINKLSPDEFLDRLKELAEKTADAIRNEPENQAALEDTWELWKPRLEQAMPYLAQVLLEEHREYPLSAEEARASVEREMGGDNFTSRLDMMHRADIGVGGDPKTFAGPGDLSINRSIGGHWRARLAALRKKAEKAKREGKQKMNVELKVCPDEAR